jgi:hypothetical protein
VADHAAVAEHDRGVGDLQRALDHLLDQQDRRALRAQMHDGVQQLVDDRRREAQRRFVEHQQSRLVHQRLCDREHLLLTARENAGARRAAFLQDREQRVDALVAQRGVGLGKPRAPQTERKVVLHRLAAEQAPTFGHVQQPTADDRRRLGAAYVRAVEGDAPALRPQQPESARISVVLPAPLLPTSATRPRSGTSRDTPSSTGRRRSRLADRALRAARS